MGIFKRNKKRDKKPVSFHSKNVSWMMDWLGKGSKAGVVVNEDNALENSAVNACVRVIGETIASLPIHIYQTDDENGRHLAKRHHLYKLLKRQPNPETIAFTFYYTIMTHLLIYGNAFIYLDRQQNMNPLVKGLYILQPWEVAVKRNPETMELEYTIAGNPNTFTRDHILHIPGLSFNGIVGRSPISLAREAIAQGLEAESFSSSYFTNGVSSSLVLNVPNELDENGHQYLQELFKKAWSGAQNFHKPIILEDDTQITELKHQSNADAQLLELRRFQLEEVARIFRVPLHMIQDLSRSTNNNIEHQSIDFVVHTIRPWLVLIEQYFNSRLFPIYEQDDYYAEFKVDALLRGDQTSQANYYSQAIYNGWMSINEVRKLNNLNPIENGGEHFVPLNLGPVKQIVNPPEGDNDNEQS